MANMPISRENVLVDATEATGTDARLARQKALEAGTKAKTAGDGSGNLGMGSPASHLREQSSR